MRSGLRLCGIVAVIALMAGGLVAGAAMTAGADPLAGWGLDLASLQASAAPEHVSWFLLLLGCVTVAFAARRRGTAPAIRLTRIIR
jgi:hypothetical protein